MANDTEFITLFGIKIEIINSSNYMKFISR